MALSEEAMTRDALRAARKNTMYRFETVTCRDEEVVLSSSSLSHTEGGHGMPPRRRGDPDARTQRVQGTGVQSHRFQPYRPLGTPQHMPSNSSTGHEAIMVPAAELPRIGQASQIFYQHKPGVSSKPGKSVSGEKAVYHVEHRSRLGENGFNALKEAIQSSNARKIYVRSGNCLDKVLASGPGIDNLISRKARKKRKTGLTSSSKAIDCLPPLPGRQSGSPESGKPKAEDDIEVFFNPAKAVYGLRSDFEEIRGRAIRRLDKALEKQDEARTQTYTYKIQAWASLMSEDFNHEKWRLQAEKTKLESQLRAFQEHKWFLSLIEAVTKNGRQMTHPEEHVIGEIKKVIEMGDPFDVFDFLTMVACVPKSYHENDSIQRIFDLLRRSMGVKPLEYRQFLEQRSLPVPQDVAKAANRQSSTGMHRLSSCGTTRSRSPPSNRGSMAEF